MDTLNLVLKREWYDMIESGEKKEEYREIKDYWCKRIKGLARFCPYSLPSGGEERICQMKGTFCLSGNEDKVRYDKVKFRRGYTDTDMTYQITGMRVGKGKPEWGAPEDKPVFIIELGEKLVENTD